MGGFCLPKRDWREIGMVLAREPSRFFRTAKKVVWEEPEPWIWKPKYVDDDKRRVGRPTWRHMILRYRQDEARFLKGYNQQRRAEAFFSYMKRRIGPLVKSRVGTMRRKDVWMRCLIMDFLVVAGEEVERGLKRAG